MKTPSGSASLTIRQKGEGYHEILPQTQSIDRPDRCQPTTNTTTAYLVKDKWGTVTSHAREINTTSTERAEATAILLAMEQLLEWQFTNAPVVIKCDCLRVLDSILTPNKPGVYHSSMTKKIRKLVKQFSDIHFDWQPDALNYEAHDLSRLTAPALKPLIVTPGGAA